MPSDQSINDPRRYLDPVTVARCVRSLLIDLSYAVPRATDYTLDRWREADTALEALIRELQTNPIANGVER
jgi:hypothetical protein